MEFAHPTKFTREWLPKSNRGIDLTEDFETLHSGQLESVRQFIETSLLRLESSSRVLETRNDASKRHGRRMTGYSSDKLATDREIESFSSLRSQLNEFLSNKLNGKT